jgi:hypothetical protein
MGNATKEAPQMMKHTTRIELALALGGYAVFCSCGNLTGFAHTEAEADTIASLHVVRARDEERS